MVDRSDVQRDRRAGSTPESVSRVMSRLRREGIIDSGRRWTAVLDRPRLTALTTS
ncbi:helix-turn-helix domain-containing protein [Georgenia sp. SYP-B2076]|uniref:helix-turn-helix domain-containing protein n=1 Tax=Georgenia sp. SYP-B2076 TaxID=2495881 RepID=UPI001F0C9464|nr:helix-turn-helix domain-containing protein [Georgenia sp. SYP-B2076]